MPCEEELNASSIDSFGDVSLENMINFYRHCLFPTETLPDISIEL